LQNSKSSKKKKKTTKEQNKVKVESPEDDLLKLNLKNQSKLMWRTIDNLKKSEISKAELISMLDHNSQETPTGLGQILERVAEGMLFGRLMPCEECEGQLVAQVNSYKCSGFISGWTACTNAPIKASRAPWIISKKLCSKYTFLMKYKYETRDRFFVPKPKAKPLRNKEIYLLGIPTKMKKEIKEKITTLGGDITSKVDYAYCCISIPSK